MSAFVKSLLWAVTSKTIGQYRNQCSNPSATQEKLLKNIIQNNKNSAYGKKYNFKNIKSFGNFQRDLPITTYEDVIEYVEAALEGHESQLTEEKPVFFAKTSGTTGKPKYIPVTPENRAMKSQLMRVWLCHLNKDHPRCLEDKVITIVSPEAEEYAPCGTPCGAESGHGYKNMSKSVKTTYSSPYEVYAVENYDAKYYALLRIAAEQSITLLYSVNPSTAILLAEQLGAFTEDIIRDVRDGTLSNDYQFEPEYRSVIEAGLRPDPMRAKQLEAAATKTGGALSPKFTWPRLGAICCWKGGSVTQYLSKFDNYYPENLPVRDIGYFASEVRGSVPLTDEADSGVLAVPTNVYEFYPADTDGKPDRLDLLSVDHLEEGKQYYIYVTTSSGLYRYDMNDIIEVTGFYEHTPLIRFVQKGKGVVSFTGEKLYESQVGDAVAQVLAKYPGNNEFIAAVGVLEDTTPQYIFQIEFETPPEKKLAEEIIRDIDVTLSNINIEYESKRKSQRIKPAMLHIIQQGEFSRYRKRSVEGGSKSDGQFKILKLTKDASFLKEFNVIGECEAPEL